MPGLLRGVARTAVVAGTATAVSGRVQRRQQARWAQEEQGYPQQAYPQQSYAQPAAAPPAEDDRDKQLAQLKELGALKEQGVLTEEEFAAQKAQILGG
jgi:Short C-terminal domain